MNAANQTHKVMSKTLVSILQNQQFVAQMNTFLQKQHPFPLMFKKREKGFFLKIHKKIHFRPVVRCEGISHIYIWLPNTGDMPMIHKCIIYHKQSTSIFQTYTICITRYGPISCDKDNTNFKNFGKSPVDAMRLFEKKPI